MPPVAEHDLAGLSAQEREFLESMDDNDEEMRAAMGLDPAAPAADGDDDDGDTARPAGDADKGGEPGDDDGADDAAGDGDDGAADEQAQPEQRDEPAVPQPVAPADAGDQRKTLHQERSEAMRRFMDGEMSHEDFAAEDSRIQDKLYELVRAEATDQARTQIAQDTMMAEYRGELSAVIKQAKAAGIVGIDDPSSDAGRQFDRAVRMFGQEAAERGLRDAPGNLAASKDALNEALALVMRRSGKAVPAAAPAPDKPAAAKARPPVDRSTLPPTLAAAPAAADAAVGGGEFAHLESLEGVDLERAIAKMTPEQLDRFLA